VGGTFDSIFVHFFLWVIFCPLPLVRVGRQGGWAVAVWGRVGVHLIPLCISNFRFYAQHCVRVIWVPTLQYLV
jgi:hypothetical protein